MKPGTGLSRTTFILILICVHGYCSDCVWNKDTDFPFNPPLIIDSSFGFVLPKEENDQRVVRVTECDVVTLACPGSELVNLQQREAEAVCVGNDLLQIGNAEWDMKSLGCQDEVKETIIRNLGSCGDEDVGVIHKIGFEILSLERYMELMLICFEPSSETTLYTHHVLHGANIAAKDIDSSRPSFKTSTGFFSVSMSSIYSKSSQLELMMNLLGDEDLANSIIDPDRQLYFAKGHMSPDADFILTAAQDATYYYINALPQWQAFNNGNWKYLEYATRDLAEKKGHDLHIYSGGWDILKLDDVNGNPVEVYLGLVQEKTVVPVPAVTWKIVHDEVSNCAAAVVGVNNPHLNTAPPTLCDDLCIELSWIDFDTYDLARGYTYCCSVSDLRAAVPHVPDLGEVCLLTE